MPQFNSTKVYIYLVWNAFNNLEFYMKSINNQAYRNQRWSNWHEHAKQMLQLPSNYQHPHARYKKKWMKFKALQYNLFIRLIDACLRLMRNFVKPHLASCIFLEMLSNSHELDGVKGHGYIFWGHNDELMSLWTCGLLLPCHQHWHCKNSRFLNYLHSSICN